MKRPWKFFTVTSPWEFFVLWELTENCGRNFNTDGFSARIHSKGASPKRALLLLRKIETKNPFGFSWLVEKQVVNSGLGWGEGPWCYSHPHLTTDQRFMVMMVVMMMEISRCSESLVFMVRYGGAGLQVITITSTSKKLSPTHIHTLYLTKNTIPALTISTLQGKPSQSSAHP